MIRNLTVKRQSILCTGPNAANCHGKVEIHRYVRWRRGGGELKIILRVSQSPKLTKNHTKKNKSWGWVNRTNPFDPLRSASVHGLQLYMHVMYTRKGHIIFIGLSGLTWMVEGIFLARIKKAILLYTVSRLCGNHTVFIIFYLAARLLICQVCWINQIYKKLWNFFPDAANRSNFLRMSKTREIFENTPHFDCAFSSLCKSTL